MKNLKVLALFSFIILLVYSCKKDEPLKYGKILLTFDHRVDNQAIICDSLMYLNEAGNLYSLDEIRYFISDVKLHNSDGTTKIIDDSVFCKYINSRYFNTHKWSVTDPIIEGVYDEISFTFGITNAKNQSFMFFDPPEVNMTWPEIQGGGYHYLFMGGHFIDTAGLKKGFVCCLGKNQFYDSNNTIINTIDNSIDIHLPFSSFNIAENKTTEIQIVMNVENWFKEPHTFDLDYDYITIDPHNQSIMEVLSENCNNVFSVGYIK